MRFSEDDVRVAAAQVALDDDQTRRLIDALRALPRAAASAPRFDLVHLLWYAGALIVIGAMGLFSTLAFDQMGGQALTGTAVIYAALFLAMGHHLWHGRSLTTPGGLLIAAAVAMVPLAVYGIQEASGVWGADGHPGPYRDFYVWVKGSWIPMEIAAIVAGCVALRFYPFPFIVAIIAVALWFISMDLTPWLFRDEDLTWALRRNVSLWIGLGVMGIAWAVDLKRPDERDFAFWLHLAGLAAFWGGLTFRSGSTELAKAVYCLINIALVALSVFLGRRAYAVFGGLGVATYLGHLASIVFEDSLLFPFALSLIGLAIIGVGLLLNRHHAAVAAWMATHLPAPLQRLRPAHATL